MAQTRRYTATQIGLHWLVVALVLFQFMTAEGMSLAFDREDGRWSGTAILHGILGVSILAAMLLRLSIRRKAGAPPRTEQSLIRTLSRVVHHAFYAILIAMPLAGLTAVLSGSAAIARIHGVTSWLLLALITVHIGGAIRHGIRQDGVLLRMLPGDRATNSTGSRGDR